MKLKEVVLNFIGVVFLALAYLSLFGILIFIFADFELSELQKRVETQYPPKLVPLLDLAISPQFQNISLSDIKILCALWRTFNASNKANLPISNTDVNLLCSKAAEASNIQELKEFIVKTKLQEISAEVFGEVRKEISSYSSTFLLPLLLLLLGFFVFFAIATYIGADGNVRIWLRNASTYALVFSLLYLVLLSIAYFIVPDLLRNSVMNSALVSDSLSNLGEKQWSVVEMAIADGITILGEWLRNVIFHLLTVFCILAAIDAVILGSSWIFSQPKNENSKQKN